MFLTFFFQTTTRTRRSSVLQYLSLTRAARGHCNITSGNKAFCPWNNDENCQKSYLLWRLVCSSFPCVHYIQSPGPHPPFAHLPNTKTHCKDKFSKTACVGFHDKNSVFISSLQLWKPGGEGQEHLSALRWVRREFKIAFSIGNLGG